MKNLVSFLPARDPSPMENPRGPGASSKIDSTAEQVSKIYHWSFQGHERQGLGSGVWSDFNKNL